MSENPAALNEQLCAYLPRESSVADRLKEAMNYSFTAGGKRLRPRLMELSFQAFGGSGKVIEPFMAAIEMIHTYSLVHDDLPCMDNDTLRRGKPTTWSVYGEDLGVLTGDALLTYAFETAAKAFSMTDDSASCGKAIGLLARKAGLYGMCGGQTADVLLTGSVPTENELDYIYKNKTGALIEASMMIGAMLAGADEKALQNVEAAAAAIGYAFQIEDDILDMTSSVEELGKNIGSDEKNGKVTYVTLHGEEKAKQEVLRLTEEAVSRIEAFPHPSIELRQLVESLTGRRN
ncbi:MAG: polyprenyl synthetase family protein [Lachnospiraceae bacterium]|nr:polyprenyl synthetase family protein [Lachnospiraceae bacterium]